jgi:fatty acid desaturase
MGFEPGTLAPLRENLHDTLPYGSLSKTGRPVGGLRAVTHRRHDAANIAHIAGTWLQSAGVVAVALWWGNPIGWLGAFLLVGRAHVRFAILAHEAAHSLLLSSRRWNDLIGGWLCAYPTLLPLKAYRQAHLIHHRDELGPLEPDARLYAGYPLVRASWWRKLTRDALGVSGWRNLKSLVKAVGRPERQGEAVSILVVQACLFVAGAMAGYLLAWPLLWLASWMTVWQMLDRLRAVAEHGGMVHDDDRRRTTHHVRQTAGARVLLVPFNTGWHLAHHIDPAVPFQNLPVLHEELEKSGWLDGGVVFESYQDLWRAGVKREQA